MAFSLIETTGGVRTNSIAILADALHNWGDSFTLGLSWHLPLGINHATIEFEIDEENRQAC